MTNFCKHGVKIESSFLMLSELGRLGISEPVIPDSSSARFSLAAA